MATVETKQIGINNETRLDPEGSDVDLGADVVTFSPALLRTMLETNTIGHQVMDQVHGAFDLTATISLQNRADSGLFDLFSKYTQGFPPFFLSLVWRPDAVAAISANNRRWLFQGGTTGNIPGPNVAFNTIENTEFSIRFTAVGIQTSAGATYTSILDGSTTLTSIADSTTNPV